MSVDLSALGRESARTVLLKGYDADGFVFFTNYDSLKGRDLPGESAREPAVFLGGPRAAGSNHW